jgi:type II secretory pathway pseudopilin PulG
MHQPRLQPAPARHAVSLIDLTVTLLLMGIMAGVAIPRFAGSISWHRCQSAAARIVADLSYAQQQAVARSTSQTVQFMTSTSSYVIPGLPHLNVGGQTFNVSLSQYPYESKIISASLGSDAKLIYDMHGRADSGGTIIVSSGSYRRTITIDASTGKGSVQ